MYAEYKRDMNHNYLILHGEESIDTSTYQVRMLVGNAIPSLLKCRLQGLDGDVLFYYDITSRQSLSALFEKKKFQREDLQLIFGGFVRAMEEMSEYLLNPEQLLLRPEYMYLDVEKRELYFCYLPGVRQEIREQFQALTEYVLPKLDHEDGRAVMLGYGIYRRALEDSFHLEYIKEELYQIREEIPKVTLEESVKKENGSLEDAQQSEEKEEVLGFHDNFEAFTGNGGITESEKKVRTGQSLRNLILGCAIAAGFLMLFMGASYLGMIPWIPVEWIIGSMITVLGVGTFVYLIWEKKKRRERETAWKKRLKERADLINGDGGDEEKAGFSGELHQREKLANTQYEGEENNRIELETVIPPKEQKKSGFFVPKNPAVSSGTENYGETVVLSANSTIGPASLVSREPGELATIYLTEELTVIGKLEHASDAVIPLPTVSRIHARIRKRGDEFYLTDLNSRNGTSVNGRMLKAEEEYLLQDEDEVDFAQARYVFLK